MNVLVCGGAGYIGAHACKGLSEAGHRVTVFDNLSTGHEAAVLWGPLIVGDLLDGAALRQVFSTSKFDAVMHFAARSIVAESLADPDLYHQSNVGGTQNLLAAMQVAGIQKLVFSSSAAVYGSPQQLLIDEAHHKRPLNPYGASKLAAEQLIGLAHESFGLQSVCLRYFNAAGADPSGLIGEVHRPETHLIPNALAAAAGAVPLAIFGRDYPTPDGTCVRDYIHVEDLARAHLSALIYLNAHGGTHAINLGNERGFSVLEIVRAVEAVTGKTVEIRWEPRRSGDPHRLVACNRRARVELGWQPSRATIEEIVDSAWRWCLSPRY